MTTADKHIECQMQHGLVIEKEWCDLAQQVDICKGCARNQGRVQSNWQKAQGKEHGKD